MRDLEKYLIWVVCIPDSARIRSFRFPASKPRQSPSIGFLSAVQTTAKCLQFPRNQARITLAHGVSPNRIATRLTAAGGGVLRSR